MALPTFIASYNTNYGSNSTPRTLSVTTQAGDLVVVYAGSENSHISFASLSGNGISFAQHQSVYDGGIGSWANAAIWSGIDTTGGTNWTLTLAAGGSGEAFGVTAIVFRNAAAGASTSAAVDSPGVGGYAQVPLTTTSPSSAVVVFSADWYVDSLYEPTWNTINSVTPTSGNGYQLTYYRSGGIYIAQGAYYPDTGAAGANNYGYYTAYQKKYSIVALEIKGTFGASTPATAAWLTA